MGVVPRSLPQTAPVAELMAYVAFVAFAAGDVTGYVDCMLVLQGHRKDRWEQLDPRSKAAGLLKRASREMSQDDTLGLEKVTAHQHPETVGDAWLRWLA